MLIFEPGESLKEICVRIIDDDMSEPDVVFNVVLTSARLDNGGGHVEMLRKSTAVTIVDDDDGGILVFELPTFEVGGCRGCSWDGV